MSCLWGNLAILLSKFEDLLFIINELILNLVFSHMEFVQTTVKAKLKCPKSGQIEMS